MEEGNRIVFSGHQPNFLPYMGVFYKMFMVDVFVLDDDVQYSNDGMHNCNFINVEGKRHKMTVPVTYNFGDKINEVKICYESRWDRKLLSTMRMNYGRCPHFEEGYRMIEEALGRRYEHLADLNIDLMKEIAEKFGLESKIIIASKDVPTELKNNDRNIYQCRKVGGTVYYSGTGGRQYNDEAAYEANGISVVYSNYRPTPYPQKATAFIQNLSAIDYIFHQGFEIPKEWREWKNEWKR